MELPAIPEQNRKILYVSLGGLFLIYGGTMLILIRNASKESKQRLELLDEHLHATRAQTGITHTPAQRTPHPVAPAGQPVPPPATQPGGVPPVQQGHQAAPTAAESDPRLHGRQVSPGDLGIPDPREGR